MTQTLNPPTTADTQPFTPDGIAALLTAAGYRRINFRTAEIVPGDRMARVENLTGEDVTVDIFTVGEVFYDSIDQSTGQLGRVITNEFGHEIVTAWNSREPVTVWHHPEPGS